MNMTRTVARNYAAPITTEAPATREERVRAATGLSIMYAAHAVTLCAEVTARRHAPLATAQDRLDRARRHWLRARDLHGATPAELAAATEAGMQAAAAVKAAAELVRVSVAEVALRRLRLARAQALKGCNTRECARVVAAALVERGLAADLPSAMVALAADVRGEVMLQEAAPEHLLAAWMRLDPGA